MKATAGRFMKQVKQSERWRDGEEEETGGAMQGRVEEGASALTLFLRSADEGVYERVNELVLSV